MVSPILMSVATPRFVWYNLFCAFKLHRIRLACAYSSADHRPAFGAGCAGSSPARRTIFISIACIRVGPRRHSMGVSSLSRDI